MQSDTLPKRKRLRIEGYDYSSCGAYFVTICTENRQTLFWTECRGELRSPAVVVQTMPLASDQRSLQGIPLSYIGQIVENEIRKLDSVYEFVRVDKYCIMPDHIHMIILIDADENGRTQFAPTLPRIVKQFKGSISKQIGKPIWQKSYLDRVIRNEEGYRQVWEYIENNPLKYLLKSSNMPQET